MSRREIDLRIDAIWWYLQAADSQAGKLLWGDRLVKAKRERARIDGLTDPGPTVAASDAQGCGQPVDNSITGAPMNQ